MCRNGINCIGNSILNLPLTSTLINLNEIFLTVLYYVVNNLSKFHVTIYLSTSLSRKTRNFNKKRVNFQVLRLRTSDSLLFVVTLCWHTRPQRGSLGNCKSQKKKLIDFNKEFPFNFDFDFILWPLYNILAKYNKNFGVMLAFPKLAYLAYPSLQTNDQGDSTPNYRQGLRKKWTTWVEKLVSEVGWDWRKMKRKIGKQESGFLEDLRLLDMKLLYRLLFSSIPLSLRGRNTPSHFHTWKHPLQTITEVLVLKKII